MEHTKRYVRLSVTEREEVSWLLAGGVRLAAVAQQLGRQRTLSGRTLAEAFDAFVQRHQHGIVALGS